MSIDSATIRPRDALDNEAHVLVVEDDGEMRQLVVKFLRQNGFRVTGARDGREMWETKKEGQTRKRGHRKRGTGLSTVFL